MNANSPICAKPNDVWTEVFTLWPVSMETVKQFKPLPSITTSERSSMVPMFAKHIAGFTSRPIDTKNIAANMLRRGSASFRSRVLAMEDEPRTPMRNAPSANENSSLYATQETKKQHPRSVRRRASSLPFFETAFRRRGTNIMPSTTVHMKNTASEPSDSPTAPSENPEPFATPVISAITPTHITSSRMDVEITYRTNGRFDHFISSIVLASSVVAESQIAAPRNRDCTEDQPNILRPTVYPSHIMTIVSTAAIGPETPLTFLRAPAENSRPSVSMRNTMPSCPMV